MAEIKSIFDVLGPVMIGPSSSHTAGAARLGKVASYIAGSGFNKVIFRLHGSFADTYKGHGTDKALVAGILGMEPHDENLRDALQIAKDKGIQYDFFPVDLGSVHPNTVAMEFYFENKDVVSVMGSSIGGGAIEILTIDHYDVNISCDYPTIIIRHTDSKGIVSYVSSLLAGMGINIASMKVNRKAIGMEASMVIEVDEKLPPNLAEALNAIEHIINASIIRPVSEEA